MPSDSELKAYSEQLPQIYRDILSAFPQFEPTRGPGFGLAFQTLAAHFVDTHQDYSLQEVMEAGSELARKGFVEIKNQIFVHPTPLGEKLISIITGKPVPSRSRVPELPEASWA